MTEFHDGIGPLAERYDGFIVDQWGVLHDGAAAYPGVIDALLRLADAGKRVVVLSNSGKRAALNRERLARLGFGPGAFAGVVTSGEATWRALRVRGDPFFARLGRRCLLVSAPGDRSVVEGLDLDLVDDPAAADFVLVTGLGDKARALGSYDGLLRAALDRDLPLICANPDIVGITAEGLVATPGALTRRYAELGGTTRSIGKPHPEVYAECRALLGAVPAARIVAVGDSLEHDIAGGAAARLATAFVTSGIHADAFADAVDGAARRRALARLAERFGATPDHAVPVFAW